MQPCVRYERNCPAQHTPVTPTQSFTRLKKHEAWHFYKIQGGKSFKDDQLPQPSVKPSKLLFMT
jgi:hypothetical protein